jgi:methylated-DNA-protein-cysteine methyltransferase related protein
MKSRPASFADVAAEAIRHVPKGRVASYGQIAALCGSPRATRQVVRLLHASSSRLNLPWHRIVNKQGCIVLARGCGFEEQTRLLRREGVRVSRDGRIDMDRFLWRP